MKIHKGFLVVFACISLLLFSFSTGESLAACSPGPSVKILGSADTFSSIQAAYDYASDTLSMSDFTLLLAGEIFDEDLFIDGGAVVLDGGYDCDFATKTSTSSLLGKITISSTGAANFAGGFGVVSSPICDFDSDSDGFTSFGSCAGSADDCNDNNPYVYPGALELCDGLDNNCNGEVDEGFVPTDNDGDGYYGTGSCGGGDDCNDNDPAIHPGAVEILGDGIDQDCNGYDLLPATAATDSLCIGCHGVGTVNNWAHKNTTAPDGTCASCHAKEINTLLPGHYGRTVHTAGNNMSAGQTISCTSCHDWHDEDYTGYAINGADIVWAKVSAAGGYNNLTCDTCHENRAAAHDAAHDNRVITDICGNCHTSDTTILGQPGSGTLASAGDVDTLHRSDCTLCHGYTGTKLNQTVVSQAIQNGISGVEITCLTCHTNFETVHAFLDNHNSLVTVGSTSCGNCHSDPPPLTDPNDPKVHSTCSKCHDSEYNRISLAAGKSFAVGGDCTTCHVDSFDTIHPPTVDHSALVRVGATSCGNCHNSSLFVDPLDPKVHDTCSTCHDSEGGLISLAAGNSFVVGGDCTTCHIDPFDTVHPDTIDHSALVKVETTSCGNCHSDPPPLVDPGDPKVHNACTTCHDSEGGLINLAAGKSFTSPGNCTTCHTVSFAAIHPDTIDHSALIKVDTTSCGNCHSDPPLLVDPVDPKVHDYCVTCHDSEGGLISLAAGKSFASPGNCTTCHTDPFATVHPDDIDHSALIKVETTGCGNCHNDPPPLVDPADPKVHNACSTCHDSEGGLINDAVGKSFANPGNCTTCHTVSFAAIHPDTIDHSALIKVDTTSCGNCHSDPPPLVDPADPKVHDACTTCHDADGGLVSLASGNTAPNECITCHGSDLGALHPSSSATHEATLLSVAQEVLVFADGTHDEVMDGDGTVFMACNTCHTTSLGDIHDNNCANCHSGSPSPYETLGGFWAGGCQQGGCHTSFHDDVSEKHGSITDFGTENNCTLCHGQNWQDFPPLPSSCANCHATGYAGDTIAPVTTSDVQSAFLVPAVINYSITDNGDKVGIGTTYTRIDGGQKVVGTSFLVETAGSHSLEFWTVDQAGNEELPHNVANFTGTNETTPPVTTSNAYPNYDNAADIMLSATDNNPVGTITTYYSLNGALAQTGNSIHVPELNGTFSYDLEFWSVDGAGNEEAHHTVSFTIHGGSATLRLVWYNSDIDGSPCPDDPQAKMDWEIHRGSYLVSSGHSECGVGGWSGVNDIVVPVSTTPYYVDIWWEDSTDADLAEFPDARASTHGEIVRLSY